MKLVLVVFCPFAAGYFLSFFFRYVNAIISKDLSRDFSLAPSELGFLTATYLLAFALVQLPIGVLLDRYGPRRVVAATFCIAAAGALVFGLAQDLTMLSVGRALIGIGVSAGLMGAIKAFTLWFPLSRLATLNGAYLAVGGLGGLCATAPAEAIIGEFGWRVLFYGLSGSSLLVALLVFTIVPERRLPGAGETVAQQFASFGRIFRSVPFWRIGMAFVVTHGVYQALQGLWLAPWLYDVARMDRAGVGYYLFLTLAAYIAGSLVFGFTSDHLANAGISRLSVFKAGLTACVAMFVLLACGVTTGLGVVLAVYGFTAIAGALAYPLMTVLYGPEMTGRVTTASNVLMFAVSFAFQWGIGAVLRLFPVEGTSYSPQGYATAFALLAAAQIAVLLWLLPMREEPRQAR